MWILDCDTHKYRKRESAANLRAVAELHQCHRAVGGAADKNARGRVQIHARHRGRVLAGGGCNVQRRNAQAKWKNEKNRECNAVKKAYFEHSGR